MSATNGTITSNRSTSIAYNIVFDGTIASNFAAEINSNTGGLLLNNNIFGYLNNNSAILGIYENEGIMDIKNNRTSQNIYNNIINLSGSYSETKGIINNTARRIYGNRIYLNISNNMLAGDIRNNGNMSENMLGAPNRIQNNIIFGQVDGDTNRTSMIANNINSGNIEGNICQGIYNNIGYEVPCPDCIAHDVIIGTQTWTGCNANVSTYANGDPIPQVTDLIAWNALTTGAWCYYNNDPSTEATYGKLYNWYAVNDPRGLAPTGYHVPTDTEWADLTNYLGESTIAGGAMKEAGLCHWVSPNLGATNSSGFSALPGGSQEGYPATNLGYNGYWWSSTEYSTPYAWYNYTSNASEATQLNINSKNWGLSIRFVKDTCNDCVAHNVTIGTQTWTGCNATVSVYRNGDTIPYVDNTAAWTALTTGAWCYYNNDPSTEATYGKLYNWYAVTDPRGIAPVGYKVPTDAEWTTLTISLGGETVAGGAMKEVGLCHWTSPNIGATNSSLFTGLPGGFRNGFNGTTNNIGSNGYWWSSSEWDIDNAYYRSLNNYDDNADRGDSNKRDGLSLRFIEE
jgi:uncharacterized protein (TIGR02145 family)